MKPILSLPINIDDLLHGKAVEWERLEFKEELELTEGRSTGIPKILRAMSENGSRPAEFEFDEDHSYFQVRLPVHPQATAQATAQATGQVTGEVTGEVAGEVTPQVTPQVAGEVTGEVTGEVPAQVTAQVTAQVQRLLETLEGEMSRNELQERLGLRHRVNFRDAYVRPALETGLVEKTNPNNPRSSKQKYRLTAQGRAWLAEQRKRGGAA